MNIEQYWPNGVITYTSDKPWKTITIMALTHWNEIAGLQTLDYLINDFNIWKKLEFWTLNLVLWNLKAFEKNQRILETDMNRVWDFAEANKNTYEYQRAFELKEILAQSDYFLDIHSTSLPAWAFLLPHSNVSSDLLDKLKWTYSISHIDRKSVV